MFWFKKINKNFFPTFYRIFYTNSKTNFIVNSIQNMKKNTSFSKRCGSTYHFCFFLARFMDAFCILFWLRYLFFGFNSANYSIRELHHSVRSILIKKLDWGWEIEKNNLSNHCKLGRTLYLSVFGFLSLVFLFKIRYQKKPLKKVEWYIILKRFSLKDFEKSQKDVTVFRKIGLNFF